MPETLSEKISRVLRDHVGYTGDGTGSVGDLPIGDDSTARKPIDKRDLREVFEAFSVINFDGALDDLLGIADGWEVYETPYFDGMVIVDDQFGLLDSNYAPDQGSSPTDFSQLFEVLYSPYFEGMTIVDAEFAEFVAGYGDTDAAEATELPSYAVYGDSLSDGAGEWPDVLARILDVNIVKIARGSLTSTEIAALGNANPTQLTFASNTVSGNGANVDAYTVDIVRNGGVHGPAAGSIAGYCYTTSGAKVPMTLRSNVDTTYYVSDAPDGTYTFSTATPFYTDVGDEARDLPKILCLGRNNIGAYSQIIADCLAISNVGKTDKMLVLSSISGKFGTAGAVTSNILTDAARKRAIFGNAFLNINEEGAENGIQIAKDLGVLADDGTYPTTEDDAAKAAGNTPDSFFGTDTIHPLPDPAHEVFGFIIANKIRGSF